MIKADGLAAGKGVVVTDDRRAALEHAVACLAKDGGRVVVEEYLDAVDGFSLPMVLLTGIGFFTGVIIVQSTRPTAHVKGEMFRQPGFIADIFEQIFQPAR